MDYFSRAAVLLAENAGLAILIIAAVTAFLILTNIMLAARVLKLSRRRPAELAGEIAENLARAISSCNTDIKNIGAKLEAVSDKLDKTAEIQPFCIRKIGFVRFDAFDDVGGEQSFSLAMLDGNNNGVILSSIYSRNDSRFYAKRISAGESSHTLSSEEADALRQASGLG